MRSVTTCCGASTPSAWRAAENARQGELLMSSVLFTNVRVLDGVTRNAINQGLIPGPRYLAASQEITVVGGLGDETLPHLPFPEFSFGVAVTGAEEMRRAVRMFLKYGVDSIKLNLSGDNFMPSAPAGTTWMSDEEVAIAVKETKMRGKRVAGHARSGESIKQCVRHGIEIIYHASFADEEALDMLEANRDKHF